MKVDFFMGQQNTILKNVQMVNQNLKKQSHVTSNTKQSEEGRKDRVFLSTQGKNSASNIIENLQKQKQALMDKKSEIRAKALQDGQTAQQVDALVETYDLQIKNIDMQIARIQAQEAEKAVQTKKENKNVTPKTQEELEKQQMNSLTNLATSAEQVDTIYEVKQQVDSEADLLKSEIELDKMYGTGKDIIAKKEKDLMELEIKSDSLMVKVGTKVDETNDMIQENRNLKENKENTKEEKTIKAFCK